VQPVSTWPLKLLPVHFLSMGPFARLLPSMVTLTLEPTASNEGLMHGDASHADLGVMVEESGTREHIGVAAEQEHAPKQGWCGGGHCYREGATGVVLVLRSEFIQNARLANAACSTNCVAEAQELPLEGQVVPVFLLCGNCGCSRDRYRASYTSTTSISLVQQTGIAAFWQVD
jgi:hypothetical protein